MATALAETVSQFVPTFNKVELSESYIIHQSSLTPTSPDGAGGDGVNTLVLTHSVDQALPIPSDTASNISSSSTRSHKSEKAMQKKIDFEAGNKTKTHRVLRTLSRTLTRSNKIAKTATPTDQQAAPTTKKTLLNRTVSQHEFKRSNEIRKSSTDIKQSGGVRRVAEAKKSGELRRSAANINGQRKGSIVLVRKQSSSGLNKSSSGLNKSLTPSDVEPKSITEVKKVAEVKRSAEIRRNSNPNLQRRNSSDLKKSGNAPPQRKPPVPPSGLRNTKPVETYTKVDALNTILNDFQRQKQRQLELSEIEADIFRQETEKYEAMLLKKKQDSDAAVTLANNIKAAEAQLENLFREVYEKEKRLQISQDELAAFNKEFEEEVKKHEAELMETAGEKSSALRMKEAQTRREMKEAWKNAASNDPKTIARKRMLEAQEELAVVQSRITEVKKELGRMKGQANKGKSSDHRLRDERIAREEMKKKGTAAKPVEYKVRSSAPREPEKRAHQSRLEEEKAKRAAKRKNNNVADLIAQQAGISRSRYGSPYRAGVAGPSSTKIGATR